MPDVGLYTPACVYPALIVNLFEAFCFSGVRWGARAPAIQ